MPDHINIRISKSRLWLFTISIALLFVFVGNLRFEGFRDEILAGDARGYYAWLPAIFVFDTLDFAPVLELQKQRLDEHYQGHYYHEMGGVLINKFTCGTALLQSPFFLTFRYFSGLLGYRTDGYSVLSQWGISIAALFYGLLGLFFARKLLISFGFDKQTSLAAILVYLFGSNLFFYMFMHPGMSHVYSFSMISILLYASRMFFVHGKKKYILLASLSIGLVFLIRPFNILIIFFLPFLAESFKQFIKRFSQVFQPSRLVLLLIPAILLVGIQSWIYYQQIGEFWIWAYQDEGFFLTNPQLSNFLWSYRKGLFLYTPLTLLSFFGILVLVRREPLRALAWSVFLFLIIWMMAGWWNWYYGSGFGMRPFVDFYALLMLLLAFLIHAASKTRLRYGLYAVLTIVLLFNLIQTYQYGQKIIHPESMNKAKYWYVFMKTAEEYEDVLGDADDDIFRKLPIEHLNHYAMDFDSMVYRQYKIEPWEIYKRNILPHENDSSNFLCVFDSVSEYNANLIIEDTSILQSKNLKANVQFLYREIDTNACMRAVFVGSATDKNDITIYYKPMRIKDVPNDSTGIWDTAYIEMNFKWGKAKPEELRMYIWNKDKEAFEIDDVRIDFFEVKPEKKRW